MYLKEFPITSGYGNRPQFGDFHAGVDFATPVGTSLPALVDGVVVFAGWITFTLDGKTYRELICILQADGYFIVYGHLSNVLAGIGQRVAMGQAIALSGNSGYTTGPHLHLEKRLGTKHPSNPLSAYQSVDITPLLHAYGQAQGGADDMTAEEYVSDIMDVIEDNPHYAEQKPEAFRAHVEHVKNLDWAGRRVWVKEIMGYNGVLNATLMRQHLAEDKKKGDPEATKKLEAIKKILG